MSNDYDTELASVLRSAKNRQHLRYFKRLFLTKEVCIAGLTAQQCYGTPVDDLSCVPVAILEEVVVYMRELKKNDAKYLEKLEQKYLRLKGQEDYEECMKEFKELLETHQVKTHDELCRKIYNSYQK